MLPLSSHLTGRAAREAAKQSARSRRRDERETSATSARDDALTTPRPHAVPGSSCIVSRAKRRHRGRALLRRAAVSTVAALRRDGKISPWSAEVVTLCADWSRAECALLAWTVARWSELSTLDPLRCATGSAVYISCGKTQSTRRLDPVPEETREHWADVPVGIVPAQISADTARHQIRLAADAAGVRRLPRAQDSTHIFRHLRASWRVAQGWSLDAVACEIGHASTDSTRHYVHALPDLVSTPHRL